MRMIWKLRGLTLSTNTKQYQQVLGIQQKTQHLQQRCTSSVLCCQSEAEDPLLSDVNDGGSDPVNIEHDEEDGLREKKRRTKTQSLVRRLRISRGHMGKKHSPETRKKISQTMLKHAARKKELEASNKKARDLMKSSQLRRGLEDEYLVVEKAILELTVLRRDVSFWLDSWYSKHDRKPTLDEVGKLSPETKNKFMRYIALQEFIRHNN